MKASEFTRYKAAVESRGMVVIEHDWVAGISTYDPTITQHIGEPYDAHGFWQILLTDLVAQNDIVQKMRVLVQKIAAARVQQYSQIIVRLKTLVGEYHRFRMNVKKKTNEFGLALKLYITLIGLDTDKADA